jgi:hypothetical protein
MVSNGPHCKCEALPTTDARERAFQYLDQVPGLSSVKLDTLTRFAMARAVITPEGTEVDHSFLAVVDDRELTINLRRMNGDILI